MIQEPVSAAPDRDKQEAIDQWSHDPCGSSGIRSAPGSAAFFDEVDHVRYDQYAPWLRDTVGFARFAGCDVLEVGYGLGTDLMQFAHCGARVHGIDLTPRHHELAARRFELAKVPADLRVGDGEALPWGEASFDAVYSFGVIHHTPDTAACVAEMRRVLRPGGTVIVGVYNRGSLTLLRLLVHEARRRRLFREPWRRTLSRIEIREHSDACPLVKLYSRRQIRRMFGDFVDVHVACRHLGADGPRVLQPVTPWLARTLGWYLIVEATRP